MRMLRDERGNILALAALSMTMLVSFLAFAVDLGNVFYTQRQLQTLADSAAIAAALEIGTCGITTSSSSCAAMQTAATTAMSENGVTINPIAVQQCAAAATSSTGVSLTLNNGPCLLASDPNSGKYNYVETVVTQKTPTLFAKIFHLNSVQLSARAEAGFGIPGPGSGPGLNTNNLTLNSGANITDATGTCGINDNATSGLSTNSSVTVNVGNFTYAGSTYNKNCGSCTTYNPMPTVNSTPVPDPFQPLINNNTITAPTTSGMPTPSSNGPNFSPGYYPNGITFSGSNTLAAGTYYMGSNVIINGGASISGSGVTIYLANGAGINSNGGASTINLSAPTSGPTANMLIWEAPGDSSAVNLDAGSNSKFGGSIYLPLGQLTLNGNSNVVSYGKVFANSLMVDSSIALNCGTGTTPDGSTLISLAE